MESNAVGGSERTRPTAPGPSEMDGRSKRTGPIDLGPIAVVRAVAKAMWVTLLNLFRKPVTVHYPDVQRAYPERYRGLLALVYEKDTGEEACIVCR